MATRSAADDLQAALRTFEDHLADLKRFASDPELHRAVLGVERHWGGFRALAAAPPNPANALALNAAGDRLLRAAEASDSLLFQRERVTLIYERLAAKR